MSKNHTGTFKVSTALKAIKRPETRSRFRSELESRCFKLDDSGRTVEFRLALADACTAVEDWLEMQNKNKANVAEMEHLREVRRAIEIE